MPGPSQPFVQPIAPQDTPPIPDDVRLRAYAREERQLFMLGSCAVGKTCLLGTFLDPRGDHEYGYYPSLETVSYKDYKFEGRPYRLEIYDTAGHEEYGFLKPKYAVGLHGYILVYSVTDRVSFEMITHILAKLMVGVGISHVPLVIVANKVEPGVRRTVSRKEGKELAELYGGCYVEASAKLGFNVDRVFSTAVQELERFLFPPPEPKSWFTWGPKPQRDIFTNPRLLRAKQGQPKPIPVLTWGEWFLAAVPARWR